MREPRGWPRGWVVYDGDCGLCAKWVPFWAPTLRRIWWARPFAVLASAPGLRSVFNAAYRTFAKHRLRFSAACGLEPHTHVGS